MRVLYKKNWYMPREEKFIYMKSEKGKNEWKIQVERALDYSCHHFIRFLVIYRRMYETEIKCKSRQERGWK